MTITPTTELLTALSPEDTRRLAALHAGLRECGYLDVEQHGDLRPGARVYHRGHQWPDVALNGTGVVLVLTERPDSSWSRSWGAPDVELVVMWDTESFGSRLSQVAQYHVHVAVEQP